MTVDPTGLSSIPSNPQSWNRYAHAYDNPLRFIDQSGKWPTEIHGQIIDKAFPGLSNQQKSILKSSSWWMDHCVQCQGKSQSYHEIPWAGSRGSETGS